MRAPRTPTLALAFLLAVAPTLARSETAPGLPSVIIFNTTCAACHEGQCSGRLSFDSGPVAARAHIERHAGGVSEQTANELFDLLQGMKERCASVPVPAPVPADGRWDTAALRALALPSGSAYFVPLGRLVPGRYRLRLRATAPPPLRAQVVSDHFANALDETPHFEGVHTTLDFSVDEADSWALRLSAQAPIALEALDLAPR